MRFLKKKRIIASIIVLLVVSLGIFLVFRGGKEKKYVDTRSTQERLFERGVVANLYEQKLVDYKRVMDQAAVRLSQTAVLSATAEATPIPTRLSNKAVKIAIIGDSMVETMGDSLEYLQVALRDRFPEQEFVMYNYGIGSENVESAVKRFDEPFSRLNRNYQALKDLKPEILIIASYAYNPLVPYSKDNHWTVLVELIEKGKKVTENVYLLAEIAPLEEGFGEGVGGVNWPNVAANEHAKHIVELLEMTKGLAESLQVGYIDAYTPSRVEDSTFGKAEYIDVYDNIHPSIEGQELTAEVISKNISLK